MANGLYVVHLQTEKEVLSKKFVKEQFYKSKITSKNKITEQIEINYI